MKYFIDGLTGYSLMSDGLIIEAENRKKAVQEFFYKTKGQKIPLKKIFKLTSCRRTHSYSFCITPIEYKDKEVGYDGHLSSLYKIGKKTFLNIN